MIFQIEEPSNLTPDLLDNYLANGWNRDGERMFRMQITLLNNKVCTVVPLRIVLNNFSFSKSQRSLLRKNNKRFDIIVRPAKLDAVKEALYQQHKVRFKEYVKENLSQFFYYFNHNPPFITYEIGVYDHGRLVAVSFFDIGGEFIYSILGLYDEKYSKYSLGIYTLLLEIELSISIFKRYYLPGYIVDVPSVYDYKTRFNNMEYFDWKGNWKPLKMLTEESTIIRLLKKHLYFLKKILHQKFGLETKFLTNWEYFDFAFSVKNFSGRIKNHMYLFYTDNTNNYIAEYDLYSDSYYISLSLYRDTIYFGKDPLTAANALIEYILKS